MAKPPANSKDPQDAGASSERRGSVYISGDLYYTPNDIAELKKLADTHPDRAAQIVSDRHAESRLDHNTERLGMILASVLGVALVVGASLTLVQLGWWQSIMFVASLLGISHVLRTVLKGEFSDTSWFGKLMTGATQKQDESDQP